MKAETLLCDICEELGTKSLADYKCVFCGGDMCETHSYQLKLELQIVTSDHLFMNYPHHARLCQSCLKDLADIRPPDGELDAEKVARMRFARLREPLTAWSSTAMTKLVEHLTSNLVISRLKGQK